MRNKVVSLIMLFVVLLYAGGFARATPITIQIEGTVTSASGSALPATIYEGITFTGTYTYDNSTFDSEPSAQGEIYYYDSPFGISIIVGGYEFKTPTNHTDQFRINIANDILWDGGVEDMYYIFSNEAVSIPAVNVTIDYIYWRLADHTCNALSSDALPTTAPFLADWETQYNTLGIFSPYIYPTGGLSIEGIVTEAILIPEPLTSTFFLMAGILLLRYRRKA